jgi:hypothetical protein
MDGDRDQRRCDTVSGYVDQIDDEVVVVYPRVVETVPRGVVDFGSAWSHAQ